ncbi:MAG: SGNH/GDSL hydrolase family protein [Deltaproteobacteria bacterium]|uniref:SGNH/GDSL hydrolase family protein n=1 Tax=Candidatus Zymogenus saltonus TaxID=2844893 RepID=A0A9D8PNH4_9DELT|nr:SGNH/GDSL hydrolase family protein [Candidatus Zymogenus saltonus]
MIKKILLGVGALIVALVLLYTALYLIIEPKANMEPDNSPAHYLAEIKANSENKVLVCVGDSITHGRISHNYVDDLASGLSDKGFDVVNAGINGDLAYNVLVRKDEIVACDPDYISIFVGTNDVLGSLGEKQAEDCIKEKNLPQKPTEEFFRESLTELVKRLKENTDAKIAILSIPPVGEDLEAVPCLRSVEYSGIIKEIAAENGLTYLPLNEKMIEYLKEKGNEPGVSYESKGQFTFVMYVAILKSYVLGRSYNEISAANGLLLLSDLVHLNGVGAEMVSDMIGDFVLNN